MMGVGLGGASLCSPILVPSALFRGARVPPQPRCPHRWVGRGCRRVARQPVASAERGQSPTLLGAGTAVGWGSWNGCGRGVPRGSPALDKDVSVWYGVGTVGREASSVRRDTWVAAAWGREVTRAWRPWDGAKRAAGLRPCKLVSRVSRAGQRAWRHRGIRAVCRAWYKLCRAVPGSAKLVQFSMLF